MKKVIRGLAASLLAAAAVGGAASPSFAAVHDGECVSGEICVFRNVDYYGGMNDMGSNDSSWLNNYYSTGYSMHDTASSGFGIDRAVEFWVDINFGGPHFTLGVNQYDSEWKTNQPNASSSSYNFNNKIDSHALYVP